MPFGLRNAPATFQRTLDIVLSPAKWRFCIVYIDDIIVFSKSPTEHLNYIDHVIGLLHNDGLSLKLNKCSFMEDKIEYLGHIITPGRLQVANKVVKAVQGVQLPKSKSDVRSFLGMCNVYRRFIKDFVTIAKPLSQLLRKYGPGKFELNQNHTDCFETLK